jgi:hypothetical protein
MYWDVGIQREFQNEEHKYVCLGDICDIVPGKPLSKKEIVGGPFKVIGGGVNKKGKHN